MFFFIEKAAAGTSWFKFEPKDVVQLLAILISALMITREYKLKRKAMQAERIHALETMFWKDLRGTYGDLRSGKYSDLEAISDEELTNLYHYMNFFNNVGVHIKLGSLDTDLALSIFPIRIKRLFEVELVKKIRNGEETGWIGLKFLEDNYGFTESGLILWKGGVLAYLMRKIRY